jgi:hypothetical protein
MLLVTSWLLLGKISLMMFTLLDLLAVFHVASLHLTKKNVAHLFDLLIVYMDLTNFLLIF